MKAIFGAEIVIENPTEKLKNWCRNNLTVANPEYAKKVRMNLWLGNTPEKLFLYKMIDDKLYLPAGLRSKLHSDNIIEAYRSKSDLKYPISNNNIKPYDYQSNAVKSLVASKYGGILISAAGSGKTTIAMLSIGQLNGKHLWLTHTKDLLDQSKKRFIQFYGDDGIGVTTEGKIEIGSRITFATIQTMANIDFSKYGNEFDTIWCDEAQRICGTPTKMQMWYKCLSSLNAKQKFGLTATYHRADGMEKCIEVLLGDIIHEVPKEATDKTTMKPIIKRIDTDLQRSWEYCDTDGTMIYARLINYIAFNNTRNIQIANDIEHSNGKSILVLSDRVDQLHCIFDLLSDNRFAIIVTGKTKKKDREQGIEDMRQGKYRILLSTYSLAKEGLDIPRLDTLVLATPNKDYAIITQSVGRIQRTFDGKMQPIVYDYVDEDIGYLERMWKKRKTSYNKLGAEYI